MTSNQPHTERELIVLLKEDDEQAFRQLYDQYKSRLAGNLYKLLQSEELAAEILQNLFLKIWNLRAGLDPEKSFRSYLFTIAENMVADHYRKAARDKVLHKRLAGTAVESYTHVEEEFWRKESAWILQRAIDGMPPQRKLVYTLCKLEGKSYKEVEQQLGISAKTINSHLFQAGKYLKEYFKANQKYRSVLPVGLLFYILFNIS